MPAGKDGVMNAVRAFSLLNVDGRHRAALGVSVADPPLLQRDRYPRRRQAATGCQRAEADDGNALGPHESLRFEGIASSHELASATRSTLCRYSTSPRSRPVRTASTSLFAGGRGERTVVGVLAARGRRRRHEGQR